MTKATSGIILVGAMLACMASEAQTCPPLASGTYTATVPYQAAGCTMALQVIGPEAVGLATGALYCPGAPTPGTIAAYAPPYPSAEGICTMSLRIETSGVLVAEEGEAVYVGSGFGLTEWVYTDDPLEVCQAAADAGLLVSGTVLTLEATHVTHYPSNPVATFACSGTQWHPALNMELAFGPISSGTINEIAAVEPAYQDGVLVIEATGEAVEGLGVVESMTTPDARVDSLGGAPLPAGTVTVQRAEPAV